MSDNTYRSNNSDLAENYTADENYRPGTVVEFGGQFEITKANNAMSSRVAGVISSRPAYLMNTGLNNVQVMAQAMKTRSGAASIVAVALCGRVPTQVYGPVKKGDLMVSAGNGFARTSNSPLIGCVIGKALEDFDGDAGIIEIVVGRV